MAEPMFGTVSPVWSAVPFPGLAWFQAPIAGNSAMGSPPGSAGVTSGMMTSMPAGTAQGFGASPSTVVSTPVAAPFPPVFNPDSAGVTAPALVMAVAMRRGQPAGPSSDQEIEDFIYDALDLFPGANDVEVRCDSGRTTLTGNVSQKRLKRDVGEIAWAIPAISDVHNNITIAPRRRARTQNREAAEPSAVAARKPA
jgi:hypothetical protein